MVKIYVLTLLLGLISGCVDEDNGINIEKQESASLEQSTLGNQPLDESTTPYNNTEGFVKYLGRTGLSRDESFLKIQKETVKESWLEDVANSFSGPQDYPSLQEKKYLVFSACKFQSCFEKGLFWYDLQLDQAIFVLAYQADRKVNYRVFTKKNQFSQLPSAFSTQLAEWFSSEKISPGEMERIINP